MEGSSTETPKYDGNDGNKLLSQSPRLTGEEPKSQSSQHVDWRGINTSLSTNFSACPLLLSPNFSLNFWTNFSAAGQSLLLSHIEEVDPR